MGRRAAVEHDGLHGRFSQSMGQIMHIAQSIMQSGYEILAVCASLYTNYFAISSMVPTHRLIACSQKVLLFGVLTFFVMLLESVVQKLRSFREPTSARENDQQTATVVYDFVAHDAMELTVSVGDELIVLHQKAGWCHAKVKTRVDVTNESSQAEGWIPLSYLNLIGHKL